MINMIMIITIIIYYIFILIFNYSITVVYFVDIILLIGM